MPQLQHMVANTFLSPYLLFKFLVPSMQSPHQCSVHIGLYTINRGRAFVLAGIQWRCYRGICIKRLLLTSPGAYGFFCNKYKVTNTNNKIICGKSDYSLSNVIGIVKSFTDAQDSGVVSTYKMNMITPLHNNVIIQWK